MRDSDATASATADTTWLRHLGGAFVAVILALTTGCGTLSRNPVPPSETDAAIVPGLPDVRGWAARRSPAMQRDLEESFRQESRAEFPVGADGKVRYAHLLLSGGGANGAFGAGLLNGWTRSGERPTFKIITGVSTGALMAPFAFAGVRYDDALREFYTTTQSRNIFVVGGFLGTVRQALFGEALADTGPLAALIAQHIDAEFLQQVAAEHRRGRRLYVGTVDLDAQRFVVWNMGLIALAEYPQKVQLFRKVMLASASIPVVFPPVLFDVDVNGRGFDEMHVDGGVGAMVFFTGGLFSPGIARRDAGGPPGRDEIFVLHNGQLTPPIPTPTPRSVRGITSRVLEATGRSAVLGDLFRINTIAQREQGSFQWVTIPGDVSLAGEEFFDPVLMRALYEVGFKRGLAGGGWNASLPGELEHLRGPE